MIHGDTLKWGTVIGRVFMGGSQILKHPSPRICHMESWPQRCDPSDFGCMKSLSVVSYGWPLFGGRSKKRERSIESITMPSMQRISTLSEMLTSPTPPDCFPFPWIYPPTQIAIFWHIKVFSLGFSEPKNARILSSDWGVNPTHSTFEWKTRLLAYFNILFHGFPFFLQIFTPKNHAAPGEFPAKSSSERFTWEEPQPHSLSRSILSYWKKSGDHQSIW